MHFNPFTVTKLNMNNRIYCFLGGIKQNLRCLQKVDDSSANNYYDKKGYSFSQTTNALSLFYLLLLTPALFVEKHQNNQIALTQHAFISVFSSTRWLLTAKQHQPKKKAKKKKTRIKAKFHSSFNYFPLLSLSVYCVAVSFRHTHTNIHLQMPAHTHCRNLLFSDVNEMKKLLPCIIRMDLFFLSLLLLRTF